MFFSIIAILTVSLLIPAAMSMPEGPYLGAAAPGKVPERFEFEFVPEGYKLHSAPVFTPDGRELYFSAMDFSVRFSERIFMMKEEGGAWTGPEVASFSGDFFDGSPSMSRDGRFLFFSSARREDGKGRNESGNRRIWYMERKGGRWSDPRPLLPASEKWQNGSDMSALGSLFFDSGDILRVDFPPAGGGALRLDDTVNSDATELHPCAAPDERYLVFYSSRPGNFGSGGGDLYISFRNSDGGWGKARNMGEVFNRGHLSTSFPRLSPDGKYFFFLKLVAVPWQAEVWWVSAEALDDLDDRDPSARWEDANTVRDIDGNIYPVVKIGEQAWMAANLRTTRYRDGTPIRNVFDDESWPLAKDGAYTLYEDSGEYMITYGALYNFHAVDNRCRICPDGWHVPTRAECEALISHLGGTETAGARLKDNRMGLWLDGRTRATNESRFSGLPAGGRGRFGSAGEVGRYATWWSSTSTDREYAWHWGLYPDKDGIRSNPGHKSSGFSVRCVKD